MTKQRLKSKAVRMIQPLNNDETARALQRASAFKPKNPYFKVVMQPLYLYRNLVSFQFNSYLIIKSSTKFTLHDDIHLRERKFDSNAFF